MSSHLSAAQLAAIQAEAHESALQAASAATEQTALIFVRALFPFAAVQSGDLSMEVGDVVRAAVKRTVSPALAWAMVLSHYPSKCGWGWGNISI